MARLPSRELERLDALLTELRALSELRERSPGTFTRGGAAFLHFHALTTGLVSDVKVSGHWRRYPAARAQDRRVLLRDVRRILRGQTEQLAGTPT